MFFQKYMPAQLDHFCELGMYRDPGDPFTYDFTTRLQLTNAFASGFQSPLQARFELLLNRGALTQLLYVSPDGYAPFGGRSSQMQLQEAILAAISEQQAAHYKTSNPKLAAAFKRMAHLHAQSIQRWIQMDPPRHIKNAFPHDAKHGIDPYGKVSVYSLFTASCLGLAYQYADDAIPEAPAPAEIGGYVLTLQPAFHKVFASCQNTYLEIDTAADLKYDATGLGRFTMTGCPLELALASPVTDHPMYLLPREKIPAEPLANAPRWQEADGSWHSLAALSENLTSKIDIEREAQDEVIFRITWQHGATTITQRYALSRGTLTIESEVPGAKQIALTIPLLQTDGEAVAGRTQTASDITLVYRGAAYTIAIPPNCKTTIAPAIATRNGLYEILTLTSPTNRLTTALRLTSDHKNRR
jgi:hypothetical protein